MNRIAQFEELLRRGRDDAILRFSLANEYYKCGQPEAAAEHLRQALALDPGYSAAWKLYGKVLAEQGLTAEAIQAYEQGIALAETRGDIQAAKEMRVFLKRLQKEGSRAS
ncbi:MAG: tetratricopeptide repeat protein, partial [Gammaproteobacteria bacterium]